MATSRSPRIVLFCTALAISVLSLAMTAPARASTVGLAYWSSALYYVAGPGEANSLTVSSTTTSYAISDPGATITAQYGCTVTDAHHASCPAQSVKWLYLKTDDLDDTVTLLSLTSTSLDCGAGTDSLNTPNPNAKPVNCEYINAPATTPVTQPVKPPNPAAPPLSLGQSVATMTQGGSVPLTLSCSAGSRCIGTLLLVLPKKAKSSGATASRRGAPNILGREKLSIAQGKKRRVNVSMTAKGRRMVKRHRHLTVTAKLKVKQDGKTNTTTQSLRIKAPRH